MWPKQSNQRRFQFILPLFIAACIPLLEASPFTTSDTISTSSIGYTELSNTTFAAAKRCQFPCGWSGQLCCSGANQCYTDSNNEAQCAGGVTSAGGSGGYWQYYTSTWVETNLITKTSVYSSYVSAPVTVEATATWTPPGEATETSVPVQCNTNAGESSCGNICCTDQQYCLVSGQCAAVGGNSVSEQPTAPLRVTSSSVLIITNTQVPTTTVAFQSAVSTGTSLPVTSTTSGGLSGGAIAGIVIGVILGLILLFLICLCLCFRAAWDALLAIFGLSKKKRKTTEVIEIQHSSRHGDSRHWYGDRPSRPQRPPPPPKKDGIGWGGIAAGLGGLAVILGLKRRYDRRESRREEEKSDYSSTYYSDDYTISEDRTVSDDRTRDTRRSRSRR